MAHIFTPALRRPLSKPFARSGTRTLIQRAIASLRARGSDAHLWLPGGDVKTFGAELVVNGGPFTATTGWAGINGTLSVSSGSLSIANNGTVYGDGGQLITVVAGRTYSITGTYRNGTAGSVSLYYGATRNSGTSVNTSSVTNIPFSATYLATSTSLWVSLVNQTNVSGQTSYLSSISVREITSQTSAILNGLTTGNYLESTGNTLGTVDNPCGLVLDALGTVGAELAAVGSWNGATGDTVINSGASTFTTTNSIGYGSGCNVTDSLISGKTYTITFTVAFAVVGTGITAMVGGAVRGSGITTSGTYSATVTATGTNKAVIFANAAGVTFTISAVSVREVSGIHLTQGTTANKPVLRRGLWNLLTYSSDFSNAAWQKTDLSAVAWTLGANVADPFGGTDAVTMVISGSRIFRAPSVPSVSGAIYTQYLWVRSSATGGAANIRLTTNNTSAWNTGSSEKIALSQSWTLVAKSGVAQTGTSTAHVMFGCLDAAGSIDATCLGNIDVYAAGFTLGTLTAAQILAAGGIPVTTTAAASNPDAGKYSWSFDGSNDSLALGSVPFNTQDDICVVAGTAIAADYANGAKIFGIRSANGNSIINLTIDNSNTLVAQFRDESLAMLLAASSGNAFSGGVPLVASARKVGSTAIIRANSVTLGTTTLAVGASAFGANLPNIGSENATKYFKGSIGPVLTIKGTVSDAELLMYERLVASLTPGAPTF